MTPLRLVRRLLDFLPDNGQSWLELGSGDGRIAKACLDAREPSEFVGVEIDEQLLRASPAHPQARFVHGDVLTPSELANQFGTKLFSRAIGNPPYGMQSLPLEAQRRVAELCPGIPQVRDWVQLDLYFILESLARLCRPGEAAFIVGAPIAQDACLVAFRRALLASASEVECYELPKDVFDKKAEVQAYLLVARFGQARPTKAVVGRLSGADLQVKDQRWIPMEEAQRRLDFGFYEFQEITYALKRRAGMSTLRDLGASIVRGSRTRWQFHELEIPSFHTTDFPPDSKEVRFSRDRDHGFQVALAGDILLPRVGTRCLAKQALVTRGQRHYTEAVYRLRVAPRFHARVVDWVLGDACTRWRQAAAKGSCAQHLTVDSLLAMPVPSA